MTRTDPAAPVLGRRDGPPDAAPAATPGPPAAPAPDATPVDGRRLALDLAGLGLRGRDTVLVHTSMRGIGPIVGGPATVLDAIRAVLGPTGTVVVPTSTPDNSTTSPLFRSAVRGLDKTARAARLAALPGFHPDHSPSVGVGAFPEYLRRRADAIRSRHPQTSFAAVGPAAKDLMARHDLTCHLGTESPLGALHGTRAYVLLLGVGFQVCTAFHLAEYAQSRVRRRTHRCFVVDQRGRRHLVRFQAPHLTDHDFADLGAAFEREQTVQVSPVGNGIGRLFSLPRAVDFAISWMSRHR